MSIFLQGREQEDEKEVLDAVHAAVCDLTFK